jgi:transcriptional regulator with XRE-family HTH domain
MPNQIRELRERAGLTQGELAKLADTTEGVISRWERAERPLTPESIEVLSRIFKVPSWQLFFTRQALRVAWTERPAAAAAPAANGSEGPLPGDGRKARVHTWN